MALFLINLANRSSHVPTLSSESRRCILAEKDMAHQFSSSICFQNMLMPKTLAIIGTSKPLLLPFQSQGSSHLNNSVRLQATLSGAGQEPEDEQSDRRDVPAGWFGRYGGKHFPVSMIPGLLDLEAAYKYYSSDPEFQKQLSEVLDVYAHRPRPTDLYFSAALTDHYNERNGGEGPKIYLKREDQNPGGSYKMNNVLGQLLLAKKLGKTVIVAETGSGNHGYATALACARLGFVCHIFLGQNDMEQMYTHRVKQMKDMGAILHSVRFGTASVKDAITEALAYWEDNMDTTHFVLGSAVGPHPYPTMVRDFQAIIGRETRQQAMAKWGGLPDVLISFVGGGSCALGLFHEFIEEKQVRMIGVESEGFVDKNWKYVTPLRDGEVGVLHGAKTRMLQTVEIADTRLDFGGVNYPGVGPEICHLQEIGRIECYSTSELEAFEAHYLLVDKENILATIDTAYAVAYLNQLCPTLANGTKVVVTCSSAS